MKYKIKFFSVMSLFIISFGFIRVTFVEPLIASTNMENINNINDIESEIDITNLEGETTKVNSKEVVNETPIDSVEVLKETPEITLEKTDQESSLEIIPQDETLEYVEFEDNKIKYESEEDYELDVTPLEGGVQLMYEIENKSAPNEYTIELELTEGSRLVVENEEYIIYNKDNEIEYLIGKPWAVDKDGNLIETNYRIEKNKLIQTINYSEDNYPLKADPLFCGDTIDNTKSKKTSKYTFSVYARGCAKTYLTTYYAIDSPLLSSFLITGIGRDMWAETSADYTYRKQIGKYYKARIKDQFICHAVNPTTIWKSSWNLDTNRPDVSLWETYRAACNPRY